MHYKCSVHAKELLPLLCVDCDGPVCLDCLTTNHAGHKMCKLSDCIEDTINQLNKTIIGKKSARFNLKKIKKNQQRHQKRLHDHVQEMIRLVTEREGEIVKEVKNVCRKTIKQIKHIAVENENQMKIDKKILQDFMACKQFSKENDEEFIKYLYFYNGLKLLQDKYVSRDINDVPFTLETCDLSVEKINDLVGFLLTDEDSSSEEDSSSDEDSENNKILALRHETNINDKSLPHQYKKDYRVSSFGDIVLVSPEKKFLCCEENLYHLLKENVHKLVEDVKVFTYVPETDEIIYVLATKPSEIFRRPVSIEGLEMLFISLGNETALCIEHDAENYLIVLSESKIIKRKSKATKTLCEIKIGFFNDTGCLMKPFHSIKKERYLSHCIPPRIKIIQSSIMVINTHAHRITMTIGFEFHDELFSYSGSIGCDPSSTFSPVDVCTDPDGKFLVIDSFDNTVHLLNPTGKFLRIIMSAEDGLSGIEHIAMDSLGWFWIGCDDGTMHFANYQHFKNTTRRDRYLEKLKDKERKSIKKKKKN